MEPGNPRVTRRGPKAIAGTALAFEKVAPQGETVRPNVREVLHSCEKTIAQEIRPAPFRVGVGAGVSFGGGSNARARTLGVKLAPLAAAFDPSRDLGEQGPQLFADFVTLVQRVQTIANAGQYRQKSRHSLLQCAHLFARMSER